MTPQVLDIVWRNLAGLAGPIVGGPSLPPNAILNPEESGTVGIINPETGDVIQNPE